MEKRTEKINHLLTDELTVGVVFMQIDAMDHQHFFAIALYIRSSATCEPMHADTFYGLFRAPYGFAFFIAYSIRCGKAKQPFSFDVLYVRPQTFLPLSLFFVSASYGMGTEMNFECVAHRKQTIPSLCVRSRISFIILSAASIRLYQIICLF